MSKTAKKALFLDRDGIINIDYGYVSKIENFVFTQGIFELLRIFIDKGYLLFIVTNQSGIGRGFYTKNDFELLNEWMLQALKSKNIDIEGVYYCPHIPDAECNCRKPKIGMIEEILTTHNLDLSHSWLIGDKKSDIELAINANIGHSIAINANTIKGAEYQFSSIKECLSFFQETHSALAVNID
ncbi:D,D-heptose 1,7-bisphosphate phosphatase [cyanobacterium G8-9]|nr:D,D-heptose 1,7-bisphosphate phosphatase [cyanobacterium G8-9]